MEERKWREGKKEDRKRMEEKRMEERSILKKKTFFPLLGFLNHNLER